MTVARQKACLYILLYVPPLEQCPLCHYHDSMIIRDSTSPGVEGVSNVLSKMVNAVTFRTAFKAVAKNSENMSSRMYNVSTMQNIRMQYELYEGLHRSKGEVLHYEPACPKDIKILRKEVKRFRKCRSQSKVRPRHDHT